MSSYDDDIEFGFFDEPETQEAPQRQRRRRDPGGRGGGPRRPVRTPTGAIALARLVGLVALGIVVVVGLVFWVGACQGQSRQDEYSSYMLKVRQIAQGSAAIGQQFATKLGSSGLKLTELETSLEQWSQQEQQAYDQAQLIVPPGPLRTAHEQVLDTLQLRALGLAGLASALAQSSAKDATTAATQLAAEAELLTASDIVWTQLYRLPATQTLKTLGVTGVVVPASQFVTNPDIVSERSFEVVYERLRPTSTAGTPSGPHGDSLLSTKAVAGSTSTTLSTSNPATIYVTADLQLQATVEDSGNFQEVGIPVTLRVAVGKKTLYTTQQTIASIQPAQQQTVSFSNLQLTPDAFGHEATVTITVGKVPGETQLSNNSATYPVFFSLSKP